MNSDHHNLPKPSHADGLFLGIDGGGTKTTACLGRIENGSVQTVGTGQGGPSNPRAVGFKQAFQSILQSVRAAFEDCGAKTGEASGACLCLAGTGRPVERDIVLEWARKMRLAQKIQLVSEAEAVLASIDSTDRTDGAEVALICGTGSLAWGRTSMVAPPVRCGGWGYLLGDEGSGFWLGQRLVQLACQVSDGRAEHSAILSAVLGELELQSAEQLVGWCYEKPGSRERIASLAPMVFQGSTDFEPNGGHELQPALPNTTLQPLQQIADRGAKELATMVSSVARRLGTQRYSLAMAGSVLCNQPVYRSLVEQHLSEGFHAPTRVHVVKHPVRGALRLATL